jgi:hypothetical protein
MDMSVPRVERHEEYRISVLDLSCWDTCLGTAETDLTIVDDVAVVIVSISRLLADDGRKASLVLA